MATGFGGHSLSSLTNSCVKLPINPTNKLAATFTERGGSFKPNGTKKMINEARGQDIGGAKYNDLSTDCSITREHSSSVPPAPPDVLYEKLRNSIDSLSDEEFYRKLMELKHDHRNTLVRLEELYEQKLSLNENDININNTTTTRARHTATDSGMVRRVSPLLAKSGPIYIGDHKLRHIDDEIQQFTRSPEIPARKDNVRDMSAKPPIGRPKTAWAGKARRSLRHSVPLGNWQDITWKSDSGQDTCTSGSDLESDANSSQRTHILDSSYSANQEIIGKMWDDFRVDEYAPRPRSRCNSRASSVKSTASSKSKEWSPKITIPKPFNMTYREAAKEKTKSKACLELEQEIDEREKAEEAECQKQFKATPAPAHTFMPLYNELREKETEQIRKNQENSKTLLMSKVKPFSFMKREQEKKHRRSQSLPLTTTKVKKAKFKARDIPQSVVDPSASDRILEEEEYRKIRIKMRAEEMLRQSSLPPNMQHRGREYTDGKMRQKLYKNRQKMAFMTAEHKFRPFVNGEVPDYDELYRNFQKEVQRKKRDREPTVVQPFNLRTSRIPSKMDKILSEMKNEKDKSKEVLHGSTSKSPSLRSSLNTTDDVIPTKTTAASKMRRAAMEKALREKAEQEQKEMEKEHQRKIRQRKLKQFVATKAIANDNSQSLSASSKSKLQNYIQTGRSRKQEYDQQLKEMMVRVESRPLLFERQSQANAKKAAEKRYQQALKDAGLDEEFLVGKGGGQPSGRMTYNYSQDSDDDSDDIPYGKQHEVDLSTSSRNVSGGGTITLNDHSYDKDYDEDSDNVDDNNRSISSIHTEDD